MKFPTLWLLVVLLAVLLAMSPLAHAKLPAPSTEEQAEADAAKHKTIRSDRVAAYQLFRAMERTAATRQDRKRHGKGDSSTDAGAAATQAETQDTKK